MCVCVCVRARARARVRVCVCVFFSILNLNVTMIIPCMFILYCSLYCNNIQCAMREVCWCIFFLIIEDENGREIRQNEKNYLEFNVKLQYTIILKIIIKSIE
jgi:hypothetical protein